MVNYFFKCMFSYQKQLFVLLLIKKDLIRQNSSLYNLSDKSLKINTLLNKILYVIHILSCILKPLKT